jgi:hypothetical protein
MVSHIPLSIFMILLPALDAPALDATTRDRLLQYQQVIAGLSIDAARFPLSVSTPPCGHDYDR